MTLIKKIYFAIGISILLVLLLLSVFPSLVFTDEQTEPNRLLYNEEGKIIASSPISPKLMPPFGTNELGENLLYLMISGAKYTLIFVILIAFVRVLMSLIGGIMYAFFLGKYKSWFKKILDIVYFVPPIFLAFFILISFNSKNIGGGIDYSYLLIQFIILVVIAVLPLSVFIGEEISSYLSNDFINVTYLAGVDHLYIFRKHIWLFLKRRLFVVFFEQIIQTLILLVHLGILGVFIGGDRLILMTDSVESVEAFSLSNEWSGLIGTDLSNIYVYPWIIITPLIGFTIVIIALKLILLGIDDNKRFRVS